MKASPNNPVFDDLNEAETKRLKSLTRQILAHLDKRKEQQQSTRQAGHISKMMTTLENQLGSINQ
ncbi:MAG: hypothetical protein JXQ90_21250 [Cyclobacteriaceae bacterium]